MKGPGAPSTTVKFEKKNDGEDYENLHVGTEDVIDRHHFKPFWKNRKERQFYSGSKGEGREELGRGSERGEMRARIAKKGDERKEEREREW